MPAQVILYLDTQGELHAEMPGRNGQRQKIELPGDFAFKNPAIMAALRIEDRRQAEISRRVAEAKAHADAQRKVDTRPSETNSEFAIRRQREWKARFDAATPEQQYVMEMTRLAAEHKQAELNAAATRDLYHGIASDFDINLANRVVTDPKRRPNRRLQTSSGGTYNPRTGMSFDSNGKPITKKRRSPKGGQVINITL